MTEKKSTLTERILKMDTKTLRKNLWMNLKETPDKELGAVPAGTGKWQWMMLSMHWDDIYQHKLTKQDYYEIAKYAAQSWGKEEGHRVRADVLSSQQYYEICKIMAQQGVFWGYDYNKLQNAKSVSVNNPVQDIVQTALKNTRDEETRNFIFKYLSMNKDSSAVAVETQVKQIRGQLNNTLRMHTM